MGRWQISNDFDQRFFAGAGVGFVFVVGFVRIRGADLIASEFSRSRQLWTRSAQGTSGRSEHDKRRILCENDFSGNFGRKSCTVRALSVHAAP